MLREAAATPNTKRTQRLHGVWDLSHERLDIAGAESFYSPEGNMCGTAMRGAVALPGSLGHITCKGIASEAGRSRVWPSASRERDGPHREGEEP